MKETNETISNRPRHEVITMMILQQNHYFQTNMQTYYEQKARNQTTIIYPQLHASFLKLFDMVEYLLFKYRKKKYKEIKPIIYSLKKYSKVKNIEAIIFSNEIIQQFLLETGVTDFVNTRDYDASKPEEEDKAKGLD